ncbi:hypothetical protein G4B88_014710 [Cannabis sativa]|uniref:SAC domain-containing protein n=1 Tax=Cannabis sativa TaxID=3483 RepID=A0A7J6I9I8_CANSA|nr:hypothetical protein G4B88_014710 [Cannabis sativa]
MLLVDHCKDYQLKNDFDKVWPIFDSAQSQDFRKNLLIRLFKGLLVSLNRKVHFRGAIPGFHPSLRVVDRVSKKDQNYEATRLHFENLVKRYGNPIIILNLIKTQEKRPRESILRTEFANAIDFINKDLSEESRLRFLHWDFHKHSRSKAIDALLLLGKYAYGLATLGHQLHALGVIDNPKIDLNDPLAEDLMSFYERMGDTLAHQYGGSAAHNKHVAFV